MILHLLGTVCVIVCYCDTTSVGYCTLLCVIVILHLLGTVCVIVILHLLGTVYVIVCYCDTTSGVVRYCVLL